MVHSTSIDAYCFAQMLTARLRDRCPEAAPLKARKGREAADVGIEDDGEFVPLLRLRNASKACNVMSLWVHHREQWLPTFVRGTPAELAEQLAGPLAHLWRIPVAAMGFSDLEPPSPSKHPVVRRAPRSSR
jgi:hypothetical protein